MAALETMQPAMAPITISAAVQPATPALVVINVRPDVKKQIVDRAKRRIARFVLTMFAMAGTDDEKAALVSLAISEATSVPGMNGIFFTNKLPIWILIYIFCSYYQNNK